MIQKFVKLPTVHRKIPVKILPYIGFDQGIFSFSFLYYPLGLLWDQLLHFLTTRQYQKESEKFKSIELNIETKHKRVKVLIF